MEGVFLLLMNIRFTIIILILFTVGFGQSSKSDYEKQLAVQDKAIHSLKLEIDKTRKNIRKQEQQERNTAKRISTLEKEMSLTMLLINKLDRSQKLTRNQINQLEEIIPENELLLSQYLSRYETRAVEIYKKGSPTSIVKLLSSNSWRQAIYRSRYLKIVSGIERTLQDSVRLLIADISNQKSELDIALQKNINIKNEKANQQKSLEKSKNKTQKELNKIKKDRLELEKYLSEKQEGLNQLETVRQRILNDKNKGLRERRIREQQEYLNSKNFAELKGQLLWPVDGKVVLKFGNQYNSSLKTTTENPGIDIEGKPNAPVHVVLNGIVTTITFIRGYGTTIIIDHGGGYYTVYTHVANLQIHEDGEVKSGDIIAYIDDKNSINGSKLHFEIWGNSQKLDPEDWLIRN